MAKSPKNSYCLCNMQNQWIMMRIKLYKFRKNTSNKLHTVKQDSLQSFTFSSSHIQFLIQKMLILKNSPVRDWWLTPHKSQHGIRFKRSQVMDDLDLGSGHATNHCAALIDLYLYIEFHGDGMKERWKSHRNFVPSSKSCDTKLGQISKIQPDQI